MPNFLNNKEEKSGGEKKPVGKKRGLGSALKMNLVGGEMVNVFDWRRGLTVVFSALIIVLILVIISYGGIFWWGKMELKKVEEELSGKYDIAALNENIEKNQRRINQEILPFQKKLEGAEKLINRHIYWNKFFQFLEDNTLSSVYYKGFSGDLSGRYVLGAEARDMEAVEAQVDRFLRNSEFVQEAWVEKVSSQPSEEGDMVSFSVNLFLKSPYIFTNY